MSLRGDVAQDDEGWHEHRSSQLLSRITRSEHIVINFTILNKIVDLLIASLM